MKSKFLLLFLAAFMVLSIASVTAITIPNSTPACFNNVNTFLNYDLYPINSTLTVTQGSLVSLSMVAVIPTEPLGMEDLEIVSNKILFTDYSKGEYNPVADIFAYTKSYLLNTQNFAPGTYILKFTALSQSGCSSDSSTLTLIVKPKSIPDTTAPEVKISFPVNGQTYSENITNMSFTTTDNNLSYCNYKLNNAPEATIKNPINGTNIVKGITSIEGSNTWSVTCFDKAGNNATDKVTFYVKGNNPSSISVNITYPVNGATYNKNVTKMAFRVTPYKNLDYCNYNLNGKSHWFSNPGVLNIVSNITSIEGSNTWSVTCFDKAGNNATDKVTFYVKGNNPLSSIPKVKISFPQNKTYNANVTFANFEVTGKNKNYTCWYDLNGITSQLSSCFNNTKTIISNLGTNYGLNNLTVYARNKNGNIGKDSVLYTLNKTSNKIPKLNLTVLVPIEGESYLRYIIFNAITNINATMVYSLDGQNNITMNENSLRSFFSKNLSLSKGNHQATFCSISKLNLSDVVCVTRNFEIIIPNNRNYSNNEDCPGVNNLTTPDITNFYKNKKAMDDAKRRKTSITLGSRTKSPTMYLNLWQRFLNWLAALFGFNVVY